MLVLKFLCNILIILVSLLLVVKLAEVIMRYFYIRNLAKKLKEIKQYVIYGWVSELEGLNEMNIWFDPLLARTNYPTLTDKDIKRLIKMFKEDDHKDHLYIRGKMAIVIRIPKGCAVTFGNGCFEFKKYPATVSKSDQILDASVFDSWVVSDEAELIKTVQHIQ